jgi:hypothetical protein
VRLTPASAPEAVSPTVADWDAFAARCADFGASHLPELAAGLGLPGDALARLRAGRASAVMLAEAMPGWRGGPAWTFPMAGADGRTRGIRLRMHDGSKLSVRGGREGLFLPVGLPDRPALLVVTEGPTDAAAALSLGFAAVGRPSCSGGAEHVADLVRRVRPACVVIAADRDGPGVAGASALADRLVPLVREVRVITAPAPHKDLRDAFRAGLTPDALAAAIDAANPLRLTVSAAGKAVKP